MACKRTCTGRPQAASIPTVRADGAVGTGRQESESSELSESCCPVAGVRRMDFRRQGRRSAMVRLQRIGHQVLWPGTVQGGCCKAQDGGRRRPDSRLQCGNGASAAG